MKHIKKRIFAAFMATAMALSLAACGNKKDTQPNTDTESSVSQTEEAQKARDAAGKGESANPENMDYDQIADQISAYVDEAYRNSNNASYGEDIEAAKAANAEATKFFNDVIALKPLAETEKAHKVAVIIADDMIAYYEAVDQYLTETDESKKTELQASIQKLMETATASQLEYTGMVLGMAQE